MGPLETRLNRELAIRLVRSCVQYRQRHHLVGAEALAEYQRLFQHVCEAWAAAPRSELDGMTPVEAIGDERRRLGLPSTGTNGPIRRVELYTDLPQAEDETECIELADLPATIDHSPAAELPPPWLDQLPAEPIDQTLGTTEQRLDSTDLRPAENDDRPTARWATDEERWQAFRRRFLDNENA